VAGREGRRGLRHPRPTEPGGAQECDEGARPTGLGNYITERAGPKSGLALAYCVRVPAQPVEARQPVWPYHHGLAVDGEAAGLERVVVSAIAGRCAVQSIALRE
jgi:hypothetical protein